MKWIAPAKDDDIVISTRIRLARNINHIVFPGALDARVSVDVVNTVFSALSNSDFRAQRISGMTTQQRYALMEQHMISPDMTKNENGGVVISDDQHICVMVNEEDHLRIQTIYPGDQLDLALDSAMRVDDLLNERLEYAFDPRLGYLTACPTNVGTGLRASAMLHLPAMSITSQIQPIITAMGKVGLTVRGIYGEGTEASAAIYQISNQVTLGVSEKELTQKIQAMAQQVIHSERTEREKILSNNRVFAEDKIFRALGTLKYARSITTIEAFELLSHLKIGAAAGLINGLEQCDLNRLMIEIQPSVLQQTNNSNLAEEQRDEVRASVIRDALAGASVSGNN